MAKQWKGIEIRTLRAQYRYTQSDLADILRVGVAAISSWENDAAEVPYPYKYILDDLDRLIPNRIRAEADRLKTGRIITQPRNKKR